MPIGYSTGRYNVWITDPVLSAYNALKDQFHQIHNRERRRGRLISRRLDDTTYREDVVLYNWYDAARAQAFDSARAVTIRAVPRVKETSGSQWRNALLSGLSGVPTWSLRSNYKYVGEFYHLRLFRDGVELEPAHPGRYLVERNTNRWLVEIRDEAYAGMYQFRYEDFLEGTQFIVELYDARDPDVPHHRRSFTAGKDPLIQILRDNYAALDNEGRRRLRPKQQVDRPWERSAE